MKKLLVLTIAALFAGNATAVVKLGNTPIDAATGTASQPLTNLTTGNTLDVRGQALDNASKPTAELTKGNKIAAVDAGSGIVVDKKSENACKAENDKVQKEIDGLKKENEKFRKQLTLQKNTKVKAAPKVKVLGADGK